MSKGSYEEEAAAGYARSRYEMLDAGRVLPQPFDGVVKTSAPRADEVSSLTAPLLRQHGAAMVLLDEPFSDEEYLAFGAGLGTATEETDPAVQPFVTHRVILNLLGANRRTDDVALQPFAENSLSLHSEGSGRVAAEQPRYIVLMCCHPGPRPSSAQTVLVPMDGVAERLSAREREVLSRTRYAHLPPGETILREHEGRPAFSFRDFLGGRLDWVNDGGDEPEAVDAALVRLHAAMYAPLAQGVHWQPGLLVVIDNRRHFHGRTAGSAPAGAPRHLKRLRIR
ncbi:TauD/TfdA family dioxygenase [Amycolatopsis jiangsuensis]|uniref:Alpha-ketoglutarate-dependent taurine dioxygenase n=1 Tax=Amycolatopsis jiangsuensis TaxID=1181879 RepID=A0A840J576_9PSEU|nr:TauD/TfdA family dioxygenase [Amycolatopsis jiangsuensis]MBB4688775.1 alpha-ketoglutarate-dependent taurine dioxygenase [Amycolatopsis jiangsuensis]